MKDLIKKILSKIGLYEKFKEMKDNYIKRKNLKGKYTFENRKKDYGKLCIVLAGYKPFLYDNIFDRIKKYVPNDVDVCILSSGKYDDNLSNIAKENDWSYLSTKRNCISLIQNIAINLFDKAEYIYKLDEDIFIAQNYFETLMKTYIDCTDNGDYKVGFVAPLIPINGYGYIKILERFNLKDKYTEKFERPKYGLEGTKLRLEPEIAKFFWGKDNIVMQIDEMNNILQKDQFSYSVCPIKFSIGAILFSRKLWSDMGYFKLYKGICLGMDEKQLCHYCFENQNGIIISHNTVVGHLSFGPQNSVMNQYYIDHPEKF